MNQISVRDLFHRVLELDPSKREEYLATAAPSDEMRREVLELLRYEAGSETFLDQAIDAERPAAPAQPGQFGVYELRELLGRGGMGAVYRAERTDSELHQVVAIKIVERAWLHPRAIERFRTERQILAGLSHPNIARLLDGGTREDGVPYLVMEYVEGLRIDAFCALHHQKIADRLRVFLPVCDAVEYAHRKLVVHRDLKPSNILVTPGGQPKLLDFGVAKALDTGQGAVTQTLIFTPDFTSPEQVRGEEITTATDVYGLGAVLYHLVTGQPPHPVEGLSPMELERAISQAPKRPGAYRPELAGDLENILLKALHAEPSRRYRSAHELAEDLERYLERKPVKATPDHWSYRARRFLARHRIGSIAAACAVLAIAAGVAESLYQAHRARQRFAQVRVLANRFIFDFEKSIRDVPATLAARQMVAATAREYLTSLSADARGDTSLTRELAESHYRLSRVEINARQSDAGLADLEKTVELLKSAHSDCCGPPAGRLLYIRALADLARQRMVSRNMPSAVAISQDAAQRSREWTVKAPGEPDAQLALTLALATHGVVLQATGKPTEARRNLTESADRGAALLEKNPNDEDLAYEYARIAQYLAETCRFLRDGPATNNYGAKASETLADLLKRHPENVRWRNMLAMAMSTQAEGLSQMAASDKSLLPKMFQTLQDALKLAKENAALNPKANEEADTLATLTAREAFHLRDAGRMDEAVRMYRESGAATDRMIQLDPNNRRNLRLRLQNRAILGEILIDQGDWSGATTALSEAERYIEQALRDDQNDAVTLDMKVSVLTLQAIVLRHQGHAAEARERCRVALDLAAGMIRKDPAMETYLGDLAKLRQQAGELGVPDPTTATQARK